MPPPEKNLKEIFSDFYYITIRFVKKTFGKSFRHDGNVLRRNENAHLIINSATLCAYNIVL